MLSKPKNGAANPVLCVEDDGPTRKVLARLLESRFDRVLTARDGQEGLDLFRRHRPGLVITDIKMPVLDGIMMAREIRQLAPATRIIVLTSHGSADLLMAAIEIGVSDYILKPLQAGRVHEAIDKCLQVTLLENKLLDAKARTENVLESMRFFTQHDKLTRLPNRTLLRERVLHAIDRCTHGDQGGALLTLDLDRFKNINDSLGHDTGDRVLKETAERLKHCVRESDTVARLSGDQFFILLDGIRDRSIQRVVERICTVLAQEIQLDGARLSLTASIGITLIHGDEASAEDLLKSADSAMHYSQRRGGNTYHFYRPEMNARAQHLLVLENTLRRSFQNRDFIVHFQPQVDLSSGELKGFEALVRWQHPELGLVLPGDFIPLAEQTGLILPLGEWVLETACREGRAWMEQTGQPLRMAVNVTGRQFWQGDLVQVVSRALARTGFPPAHLELELTESMVIEDVDPAIETMHALAAMGIRLSIDDFGTGYSSLSSLQQFPINTLKIDKSFIKHITDRPNDQAIATAIIALAHAMKLEVIAEGIERAEQLACLKKMGCNQGQGFLFSPAMSSRDAQALALEWARQWPDVSGRQEAS